MFGMVTPMQTLSHVVVSIRFPIIFVVTGWRGRLGYVQYRLGSNKPKIYHRKL